MTTSLFSTMNTLYDLDGVTETGYYSERNELVSTSKTRALDTLPGGTLPETVLCGTGAASPITITVPDALATPIGYRVTIKDRQGHAATRNITVTGAVASQIDGATSVAISDNYGHVVLVCNGVAWSVLDASAAAPVAAAPSVMKFEATFANGNEIDSLLYSMPACKIATIRAHWSNVPSGADLICDIVKNGTDTNHGVGTSGASGTASVTLTGANIQTFAAGDTLGIAFIPDDSGNAVTGSKVTIVVELLAP